MEEDDLLQFFNPPYTDKVTEAVELFMKIRFPELTDVSVEYQKDTLLLHFTGGDTEEVKNAVTEFVTPPKSK